MVKQFFFLFTGIFLLALASCAPSSDIIKDIHIGLHNNNKLLIQIDVATTKAAQVYGECWVETVAKWVIILALEIFDKAGKFFYRIIMGEQNISGELSFIGLSC